MSLHILKHKNKNVAAIDLNEDGEIINSIILFPEEMPILGNQKKNLSQWIQERAIPNNRTDLDRILQEAGCNTPQEYLIQNLALSLSDTYWICPEQDKDIRWEDVTLYQHPTGQLTFHNGINATSKQIRNNSSLGGSLEKYNVYEKDGWHLIKRGNPQIPSGIQNINEAFASMLHERQGFREYTRYTLNFDPYGQCESCDCRYFTNEQEELVSAYNVTGGIIGSTIDIKDSYQEYLDICIAHGLSKEYVTHFMDYMLLTDFLITNTDRHWENFGILRDPDTLQFIKLAPIFDSGTSMAYDDPFVNTRYQLLQKGVHGIALSQAENLELIKDKYTVDINKLPSKEDVISFYETRGVQKERAEQIAGCFSFKKDMLIELQHHYTISIANEYKYGDNPPCKDGMLSEKEEKLPVHFCMLCGIPDAGKEQIGNKLLAKYPNAVYIRTNNIRKQIGLDLFENEDRVFWTAYQQIRQALIGRKDVIYVATNLDKEERGKILSYIRDVPNIQKELYVIYKNPLQMKSNIPTAKLINMAKVLQKNKPTTQEGWDNIEIFGKEPVLEKKQEKEDELEY